MLRRRAVIPWAVACAVAVGACIVGVDESLLDRAPASGGPDGSSDGSDGASPESAAGDACRSPLPATASNVRGGDGASFARPDTLDYLPTVVHEAVYRMWWTGAATQGTHILYAEATSLDGPWHARASTAKDSYDDAFQPSGDISDFDGTWVLRPSVIRVDGLYYMYYVGFPTLESGGTRRLGVATSVDGYPPWTRKNGHAPVVAPIKDTGAGVSDASAFAKDGYVYLAFTDDTASGADAVRGAEFVIRSKDPLFQSGVEELGAAGFAPAVPGSTRAHAMLHAKAMDWTYAPALDAYLAVLTGAAGQIVVQPLDASFQPLATVTLSGAWAAAPGIVRRPDGQLDPLLAPALACDRVSIDLMRPVGLADPGTWELGHIGADIVTGRPCACTAWGAVLEGAVITTAPDSRSWFVRDEQRLMVGSVMTRLLLAATPTLRVPDEVLASIPDTAALTDACPGAEDDAGRKAFVLDGGALWSADCDAIFDANHTVRTSVSAADYDRAPKGPALYCVH